MLGRAALGRHVEGAHRIDLVAKELDADGLVFRGRENVHDAAATGERTGLFYLRHGFIAESEKTVLERRRIGALARREHEHVFT